MNKLEIILVQKDGSIKLICPTSLDKAAQEFRHLSRSAAACALHRCGSLEFDAIFTNYDHFKICGY